ncbi:DNA repair protein RadC [Candidatus Kapaibacterium sp.]
MRSKESPENEYTADYTPINKWREDDRPRERLSRYGSESLSDSELLAIIIGSGTVGKSAVDISRILFKEFVNLANMARADIAQFSKFPGIGIAKAVTLAATFELSRRVAVSPFDEKRSYSSPHDVADYFIPRLRDSRVETFRIVLLDSQNKMIREQVISEGILTSTLVHPREVFRPAIVESAASIILIHNHPSGSVEPSSEDKIITKKLVETGEIIGIKVIDHIIIGGTGFSSFRNLGLI